jgi:hypothetical protein
MGISSFRHSDPVSIISFTVSVYSFLDIRDLAFRRVVIFWARR